MVHCQNKLWPQLIVSTERCRRSKDNLRGYGKAAVLGDHFPSETGPTARLVQRTIYEHVTLGRPAT